MAMDMDWFSWLSKTGLNSSLVYQYGLTFSHNELQEADIVYFNHEFLQSMGISIAKHRLEILKLARKSKYCHPILIAIKRTKRNFSKYLRTWIRCDAVVPTGMINRNRRLMVGSSRSRSRQSRAPLLLTNGSPILFPSSRINSFSSPWAFEFQRVDEYWPCPCPSADEEEMRWDSMFQNLKPT